MNRHTVGAGAAIAIVLAAAAIFYGFRARRELFVFYGYVYGLIAIDALMLWNVHDELAIVLLLLVSTIAVIVAMVITHRRFHP